MCPARNNYTTSINASTVSPTLLAISHMLVTYTIMLAAIEIGDTEISHLISDFLAITTLNKEIFDLCCTQSS